METLGKVVDSTVIVGSAFVVGGSVKAIAAGISSKSTGTVLFGALTLLIGAYAFKQAVKSINE